MTELTKTMEKCIGHQIRVELLNGNIFEGKCVTFSPPFDNESDIAEFDLKRIGYDGLLTIAENEIKEITIID